MSSFLSESYAKPNLIEKRLVNKIIEQQNNKISFENKTIGYIKKNIYIYWKIIISLLIIYGLFYWRYREVKNIRKNNKQNKNFKKSSEYFLTNNNKNNNNNNKNNNNNYYEEDSEYYSSDDE